VARDDRAQPPKTPAAITLRLDAHEYVAVRRRDEEAVYEIVHENVRDVRLAKTLAREAAKTAGLKQTVP
jgi:hypothetical protein